jgi:uncharacterized protein (UPF0276 family)
VAAAGEGSHPQPPSYPHRPANCVSNHLCWGSVDGRYTHDLLPMPYTWEAVEITAQKIRQVRDFVEAPVVVENVSSYAEFHASEMTEWEFLTELVDRADCGILLDVNNMVWKLYARAIERCGPTATLLEWDDKIPSFEEVHAEPLKANQFLKVASAAE